MYTYLRLNAAVFFLLVAMIFQGTPALAQTQDQPQVDLVLGIVDFTLIMSESRAAKSLKAQADKQATAFEAEYKKQGKAFTDAERKLEEQRQSLSKDDLQKKVAELNAQGKKIKNALAERKQTLDSVFSKAREQVKDTLIEIIADIAKKRGMTLVLNKSDTILSAEGFDFTGEAMKRLNEKLPSVKVQVPN